jgi:hypothetical protein
MVEAVRRKRALEPRVDENLQVKDEPVEEVLPLPPLPQAPQPPVASEPVTQGIPPVVRRLATIFQWLALLMLIWTWRL